MLNSIATLEKPFFPEKNFSSSPCHFILKEYSFLKKRKKFFIELQLHNTYEIFQYVAISSAINIFYL